MDKHFFDTVRPLFGKLSSEQVDGLSKVVAYGKSNGFSKLHLAYILASVFHETAKWMQPIREGATRYGTAYTDAQSRRAVANIHAKGIISTNYALPAGPYNLSYYGRGLIQITWYDNYKKFGIAKNPDKALEWDTALDIVFRGMKKGMFTGKKLSMIKGRKDFKAARAIVNGDVRKNGQRIADEANVFFDALKNYGKISEAASENSVKPVDSSNVRYSFSAGTIRNMPVVPSLLTKLSAAIKAVYGDNAYGVIYSGGQLSKRRGGVNGKTRTGSVRHDGGKAADVYVYVNGKKIGGLALAKLGQYWLAMKYGSVGLEMRVGGIHLDIWNPPPKGGALLWTYAYSDAKPWGSQAKSMLIKGNQGVKPPLAEEQAEPVNKQVPIPTPRPTPEAKETKTLGKLVVALAVALGALVSYLWENILALF